MDRAEHLEPFYPQAEVQWLAAPRSPGVGIGKRSLSLYKYVYPVQHLGLKRIPLTQLKKLEIISSCELRP